MIDNDTIAAISTPIGTSGIGIVKISGTRAFSIARKIFLPSSNHTKLATIKRSTNSSFSMYYGWIIDPTSGVQVDEVLISLMCAPRTYTREDVVEINCHGGLLPLRKVLEICLEQGTRLAEPGEFTKRAFLNGRIDLSQAESVLDIVQAKTEEALKIAVKMQKGEFSKHIYALRENFIDILSLVEVEIDFAEEEIETIAQNEKEKQLRHLLQKINHLLERAKTSQFYRDGIKIVIAGKTNVGKSSLLNNLLERERAIVSNIPGTTRDTIEETINIKGFPAIIIDTAGLGAIKDFLEEKSAAKTYHSLGEADIVLLMLDGSASLTKEDEEIFVYVKNLNKQIMLVVNKVDLPQIIDTGNVQNKFPCLNPVEISATKNRGIDKLKNELANCILKNINPANNDVLFINLRQKTCLEKAKNNLRQAQQALKNDLSSEFLAFELREAIGHLDEITGQKLGEEVLNNIFSKFCIGK